MKTLWSPGVTADQLMLDYTVADDRVWDTRLLRWDVLGSLGHLEGLRKARLVSPREYAVARKGLRAALRAIEQGKLTIGPEHEDGHSAVELWLTRKFGEVGERIHTGRSRNDQVAVDLRLFMKDRVLSLYAAAVALIRVVIAFGVKHDDALIPGYTHQRRAMPSSVGAWALAHADGLLGTLELVSGLWPSLDRCPLGSAAGYGSPLPLDRSVTARALGFAGLDAPVTTVQNARGKLEASVLFFCVQLGHDLGKLSADVILWSSEEFGYLVLPREYATGSSIMPHKKNPDLFELTRARVALIEGELASVLALRGKLGSGYHRDFQFLKAPLFRGTDHALAMVEMLTHAVPALGVDRVRGRAAISSDVLATDEVMRRVRRGMPFRSAYREVAAALRAGEVMPEISSRDIIAARKSQGGLGNLGAKDLSARLAHAASWQSSVQKRFAASQRQLAGR